MQINITTDYALRCVIYLASTERCANSKEVGEAIKVSRDFVQRIMQKLRFAGLVENTMGAHGGYSLAKPPEQIHLSEIFDCMEDTMCINRCTEDDKYCNLGHPEACNMHLFYMEMQYWMNYLFDNTTIADILKGDMSIFRGLKRTGNSKIKEFDVSDLKTMKKKAEEEAVMSEAGVEFAVK